MLLPPMFVQKPVRVTAAPTTLAPTTAAPTTLAPTTLAPTTLAPTTAVPTTAAPTTAVPTLAPDLSPAGSFGLAYNGGPVMTAPIKIYPIYYGSWTTTTASNTINIVHDFLNGLAVSPWWNILTSYYQLSSSGVRTYVPAQAVSYGQHVIIPIDSSRGGTTLSDNNVYSIIHNQIANVKSLPTDVNGIYVLITSAEVTETSGFCTSYCGWHTYGGMNGQNIKYAFMGDATTQCPGACTAFSNGISPNNDLAADGIVNILAHEVRDWCGAFKQKAGHAAKSGIASGAVDGNLIFSFFFAWFPLCLLDLGGGICVRSVNERMGEYKLSRKCRYVCMDIWNGVHNIERRSS